ncbi:hypothetical protein H257_09034 [Aphanomyces astaci]|uniref:Helicase-associated domain-containing protein n=1 Tax=Aphanomyces astaci TaxID=112090 RepID=W4GBU3_APHAT|nr:hypothetical protein H257_09034 [Aphanomyces astaci]ETV77142.1 hypothetical protein H257_09034 [Aphanomyces astaci]|eukprot:XP_009833448.1 hypothetical protein H257_09034 [Aphanomyces astaci]
MIKPLYSIEKQKQLLQVVQAVHEEAGRPKVISIKTLFRIPSSDKYPLALQGIRFPVSELRKEKREGRLDPDIVAALDAIGFVWNADQFQWSQTQLALTKYKELHGNLLVQSHFNVPKDDPVWPTELWSKKLGVVVARIRAHKTTLPPEKKQWLDSTGFVWDAAELHWKSNLAALETFKAIHDHLSCLRNLSCQQTTRNGPSRCGDSNLGNWLDVLNSLGFVWLVYARGVGHSPPANFSLKEQQQILQVVQVQRSQQRHTKFVYLPSQFRVPDQAPWPLHLHKVKLNISKFRRANIQGNVEPSVVQALDAMHFVWNGLEHQWSLNMEALGIYKAQYQDLLIPKLGMVVENLRARKAKLMPQRRQALNAMGFVWNANEAQWQLNLAALETFKQVHGHVNALRDCVVPSGGGWWPSRFWGLPLGYVAKSLRKRVHRLSNKRRHALDELGFVWKPLEDQWNNRNLLALKTFKRIYCHMKIPMKFIYTVSQPPT